jgi:BASS family bile acid:Na+ symporter
MSEPYAVGLLFLGMAPCAPFLPAVAQKAKSDLGYVAAFMILTAVGTVLYMPFMVPVLVKGFSADAWKIAKPLVLFILAPLAVGILVRLKTESVAEKTHPIIKKITTINTIIMMVIIFWIYGKEIIGAIGSFAIASQILFYGIITVASYALSFGLPRSQKSALSLGVCTRNIGAAIAPLFSTAGTDQRAIVMCAIAVPVTILCAFLAAKIFGNIAQKKHAMGVVV